MIAKRILLFSLLLLPLTNQAQKNRIEEIYDSADFVALVSISKDAIKKSDYVILDVLESFKGYYKQILFPSKFYDYNDKDNYVLFSTMNKYKGESLLLKINVTEILPETKEFLFNLPCFVLSKSYDEQKKENPNLNRNCFKNYDPVCGCDGNTYGNICEMDKAGIARFYPGKCDD